MTLKWGIDIRVRTTIPGNDGWTPLMLNNVARLTFASTEDLFPYLDRLNSTSPQLKTRVVEIQDPYEPTYTL